MQLGLTWPLQRLLKVSVPYGEPIHRGLCWDAHCITLHGRSSLLLVHCESRYTCVRYDLSTMDWNRLEEIKNEYSKGAVSVEHSLTDNDTETLLHISTTANLEGYDFIGYELWEAVIPMLEKGYYTRNGY